MDTVKIADTLFEVIEVIADPNMMADLKLKRIYDLVVSVLDFMGYVEKPQ